MQLPELGHVLAYGRDAVQLVAIETQIAEVLEVYIGRIQWLKRLGVCLEELLQLVLVELERGKHAKVEDGHWEGCEGSAADAQLLEVSEEVEVFGKHGDTRVLA